MKHSFLFLFLIFTKYFSKIKKNLKRLRRTLQQTKNPCCNCKKCLGYYLFCFDILEKMTKMTKKKNNKQPRKFNKTKKQKQKQIKGGTTEGKIKYNTTGDQGYCGDIITPNLPFSEDRLITKIATKDNITTECAGYAIINKINNSETEYDKMQVKILCNPLPISYAINLPLIKLVSAETFNIQNVDYTDAMLMEKGEISIQGFFINNANNAANVNFNQLVFDILFRLIPIVESLNVLFEKKYIHGDIKLNNIMIKNNKYYLIDLGTFIEEPEFIETAEMEISKNKLAHTLQHTPIESLYINKNKILNEDEYQKICDKKYEENYSKVIVNSYSNNRTTEYFKKKFDNDVAMTKKVITFKNDNNKNIFYKGIFSRFDVFSFSFSIMQLLTYTNNPIFSQLYEYLIEYGYTFDLQKRHTIPAFLHNYKNIINNIMQTAASNTNTSGGGSIAITNPYSINSEFIKDGVNKTRDPNWAKNQLKIMLKMATSKEDYEKGLKESGYDPKTDPTVILAYKLLETPENLGNWYRNREEELKKIDRKKEEQEIEEFFKEALK